MLKTIVKSMNNKQVFKHIQDRKLDILEYNT